MLSSQVATAHQLISQARKAENMTSDRSSGKSAHNVVLVHGAYADGSSWSEVIGRLQAARAFSLG